MMLYRGGGGPAVAHNGLGMDTEFIEWWTTDRAIAAQYGPTILERALSAPVYSVINAGGGPKTTAIMRRACLHGYEQHRAGRPTIAPLVVLDVIDDPE